MHFSPDQNQRFTVDYERLARPSPGQYQPLLPNFDMQARRPSSSLAGTAPFLATGHGSDSAHETRRSALRPGPGSYELVNPPKSGHSPQHSSMFRSEFDRFSATATAETPAPGQYDIPDTVTLRANPGMHLRSHAPRDTGPPLSDNPGVGHYTVPPLVGGPLSPYPSSNFTPNSLDRFGKPLHSLHQNAPSLGPGSYEPGTQNINFAARRCCSSVCGRLIHFVLFYSVMFLVL